MRQLEELRRPNHSLDRAHAAQECRILHLAYQGAPPHGSHFPYGGGRGCGNPPATYIIQISKRSRSYRRGVRCVSCCSWRSTSSMRDMARWFGLARCRLAAEERHIKQVTVVDDDVDPIFNPAAGRWAVAGGVQVHKANIEKMTGLTGIFLGSIFAKGRTRRAGARLRRLFSSTRHRYDAKQFSRRMCMPARDVMEKVDKDWQRYGIRKPTKQ